MSEYFDRYEDEPIDVVDFTLGDKVEYIIPREKEDYVPMITATEAAKRVKGSMAGLLKETKLTINQNIHKSIMLRKDGLFICDIDKRVLEDVKKYYLSGGYGIQCQEDGITITWRDQG